MALRRKEPLNSAAGLISWPVISATVARKLNGLDLKRFGKLDLSSVRIRTQRSERQRRLFYRSADKAFRDIALLPHGRRSCGHFY